MTLLFDSLFSTGNIADTDTYLMCMFAVYIVNFCNGAVNRKVLSITILEENHYKVRKPHAKNVNLDCNMHPSCKNVGASVSVARK